MQAASEFDQAASQLEGTTARREQVAGQHSNRAAITEALDDPQTAAEGVAYGPGTSLPLSDPERFLRETRRTRTPGNIAFTLAAEFTAKAVASGLHFGFVQGAMLNQAAKVLEASGIENPLLSALLQAAITAPVLASAHYLGEVVIRNAIVGGLPVKQTTTDVGHVIGDENAQARDTMKRQQAAARPGNPIGNIVALTAFTMTHGTRSVLGLNSYVPKAMGSAVAGGLMAVGHTLINYAAQVKAAVARSFLLSPWLTTKAPRWKTHLSGPEPGRKSKTVGGLGQGG